MRPWTLAVVAGVAWAGCYDWNVGPSADANGAADAKATKDAGVDVELRDGGHDVGVDVHVVDAPQATSDAHAHADAGNPCPSLLAGLTSSRKAAQTCTQGATPLECQLSVTDPCGCAVFVRNAAAQSAFQAAVTAYTKAGCGQVDCPGSCGPLAGTCLMNEVDGGSLVTACYP